jgi:hypothetical protein
MLIAGMADLPRLDIPRVGIVLQKVPRVGIVLQKGLSLSVELINDLEANGTIDNISIPARYNMIGFVLWENSN